MPRSPFPSHRRRIRVPGPGKCTPNNRYCVGILLAIAVDEQPITTALKMLYRRWATTGPRLLAGPARTHSVPAELPEHGVLRRVLSELVSVGIVERISSRCLAQVRELIPARGALKLPKEAVNRADGELDSTGPGARAVGYPD